MTAIGDKNKNMKTEKMKMVKCAEEFFKEPEEFGKCENT